MRSIASDTNTAVQRILDSRWRTSTASDKAELVHAMCNDCTTLALSGIAQQYPDATPDETLHQLALRRYGPALADQVYSRP